MNWVTVLSTVGAILTTLGVGEFVKAWLARRRPTQAERVRTLNEATLAWAEELQEDAATTRREAATTRRELTEVRQQAAGALDEVAQVRTECAQVRRELAGMEQALLRILRLVHRTPDMTVERLRELVPDAPPVSRNGTA